MPGALGIALMSFTETIAAGRAFVAPVDPPINPDRELLATGAANLAGALFGSATIRWKRPVPKRAARPRSPMAAGLS
ncbi:SulP family inorganic anion transporter, partial [Mesorhizobium sp. M8A.F.Ca.ET.208.01.1.1]|uniref:SulP family inorganic anion transporter n=1 Tax=Mesorhizobium sp. M8A.F.Ca.ET.208.01.1.1 TaxID=2563969 RepID=UPI0032AF92D0